jgi:hypothetical protein
MATAAAPPVGRAGPSAYTWNKNVIVERKISTMYASLLSQYLPLYIYDIGEYTDTL